LPSDAYPVGNEALRGTLVTPGVEARHEKTPLTYMVTVDVRLLTT
jgi:hypothetical protein